MPPPPRHAPPPADLTEFARLSTAMADALMDGHRDLRADVDTIHARLNVLEKQLAVNDAVQSGVTKGRHQIWSWVVGLFAAAGGVIALSGALDVVAQVIRNLSAGVPAP